jgi:C-terminal processing protease CtpA/Prc
MLIDRSVTRVSVCIVVMLVLLAGLSLTSCTTDEPSREIQNLRAFAKVYGYVRFFHPSDEASSIDWDRFAVHGVTEVREAASTEELRASLERLFDPLAPTLQVFPTGETPEPVPPPDDLADLRVVAWQHYGFGMSGQASIYQSKRTGRVALLASGASVGTLVQSIAAEAYRGRRLKLAASVRAEVTGGGNQGQMWLRVDRMDGRMGFTDNMDDRPIRSPEWQRYEIEGEAAEDANRIYFGCSLRGKGRVWVDDMELMMADDDGRWRAIKIDNSGFEEGDADGEPIGWRTRGMGYRFQLTEEEPDGGLRSVVIEDEPIELTEDLFEAHPAVGEFVEAVIGGGLSVRVPLALYGSETETWPRGDVGAMKDLRANLDSVAIDSLTADDVTVRLADIVIAWNVFQHFYPYFEVVDVDWDAQLTQSLRRSLADESAEEFFFTLSELVANLQDGHGRVFHKDYSPKAGLPLLLEWVEGQVVVTASSNERITPGDVVERIDGVAAQEAVIEAERYISGSPQWKRWRAMRAIGAGDEGSTAELVIRRGDETLAVEIPRRPVRQRSDMPTEPRPESIEELEPGIFYVDLSRAEIAEIDEKMDEIAAARGVVFDLRGYPNGTHKVISHLLDEPDTTDDWMRVAQIIHPDHVEPAGFREIGWNMKPLEPHIEAKVVFMTDGRAISYAESVMGFIEGYRLAEIVGQPTAGANGNVVAIELPGGFRVMWTGMKVVKHDGSQQHLVGILPTVPAERTIAGVREGRDEVLERALEISQSGEYEVNLP